MDLRVQLLCGALRLAQMFDLLDPLTTDARHVVVQTLAMGYMGDPFPDSETVQHLIELQTGQITSDQYDSWVLESVGPLPASEPGGGIGHIPRCLENGFEVGRSRGPMLELLSTMDDTASLVPAIIDAAKGGLPNRAEADTVLSAALRLSALPPLTAVQAGGARLPEDYPPPTPWTTGTWRSRPGR